MKKLLAMLTLALAALISTAETVNYGGYRVGASEVMNEPPVRVHKSDGSELSVLEDEEVTGSSLDTPLSLVASQVNGQKILRWWSYNDAGTGWDYEGVKTIAQNVYAFDWKYNTVDYTWAKVVVDYDYIKYNLSYNDNGGSGTAPSSKNNIVYTNSVTLATNTFTRTGYTWAGWTNNLTTTVWQGKTKVTGSSLGLRSIVDGSSVVLYAKWAANTYTVKFNANGGSGTMENESFTYDTARALTANAFTRTGYTFAGWNTKADGTGTSYANKQSVSNLSATNGATVNLYAQWTAKTYAVTLDWQDGSSGTPSVTATYGAAMPTATMPTRTGYTFGGYYTIKNGGGVKYYNADGSSVKEWDIDSSNPVLYANWTPVTYTVTLDRQGGSGGDSSAIVTYDAVMPQVKVPERAGYDFAGYYTAVNGDGTQYYASNGTSARKWDMTAATTLYAKWTAKKYSVTLDRQNGSGGSSSVVATYGSAMPTATMPTRTGYTFGGYFTATNGGGTQYYTAEGASARAWDKTAATILYAKWTANTYTVTLDMQSGTGGSASVTATFDSAMPTATMPTRTGYTFGGYFTAKNGGGAQYYTEAGESVRTWDKTAATILYAKWTAKTYAVTLDWQDGSDGTPSVTATFGSAMPTATMPTRTGYTFGGYFTETDGGGTQYYTEAGASARAWDKTAATTLYAKWTAKTYTIIFDQQSGTGGSSSVTATYGAAMPTATMPTRTGYTFGGYFTETNGGGTQYYTSSGASARAWDIASATTLYAKWTANTYNILFDNLFNYNSFRYSESCKVISSSSGTLEFPSGWPKLTVAASATQTRTRWGASGATGYYEMSVAAETKYRFSCYVDQLGSGTDWGNLKAYYVAYDGSGDIILDSDRDYRLIASGKYEGTTSAGVQYGKILGDFTTPAGCAFIQIAVQVYGAGKSARFMNMSVYRYDPYALTSLSSYLRRRNQKFSDDTSATIGSCMTDAGNSWFEDPTRAGYTFKGWYNADGGGTTGGTGTQYTSASKPVANNDLHLWSKWTANSYTVKFNAGGGSGTMSDESFTYDTAKALTANAFTRTGYTFAGWATSAGGSVEYVDGQIVSNMTTTAEAVVPLFAVWTPIEYTITFDGNGADNADAMMDDTMILEGVETKTLVSNKFEKTGYTFAGWATNETEAASLNDSYADGEDVVSTNLWGGIGETNVFYAVWQTNTYTVVFNANGGSAEMENQVFVYDQAQNLAECAFSLTGGIFLGWATNQTGDVVFTNKAEVSNLTAEVNGEVRLYAVWDYGELSKAMHCYNLRWVQYVSGNGQWGAVEGEGEGYNSSGSSLTNAVVVYGITQSYTLGPAESSTGSGNLSFWYKMSDSGGCTLDFQADTTNESLVASKDWQKFGPVYVDIKSVAIGFVRKSQVTRTVWIDQMTWVPAGAEPTEADRPVVSGFTPATAGGFTLSVDPANISDSFSYQILATNELVGGAWPVKETLTATELTEGYAITPEVSEPTMFYKVKVIAK